MGDGLEEQPAAGMVQGGDVEFAGKARGSEGLLFGEQLGEIGVDDGLLAEPAGELVC